MNNTTSVLTWTTTKRSVEGLLPSGYNPRKMSESERRDLENSIKEFGTVVPVVLNIGTRNNVLIGGHQRVSIYADLGIDEIDCMIPSRELEQRTKQSGFVILIGDLIEKITQKRKNGVSFTKGEKLSLAHLKTLLNKAL